MSLGFDAISALPFATSGPDNDVNVTVTGNQLTISIGSARYYCRFCYRRFNIQIN